MKSRGSFHVRQPPKSGTTNHDYTGDPIRKKAIFYNNYKKLHDFAMVDEALDVSNATYVPKEYVKK
ncbi:hypothetical protein [Paenibacillus sp. KN14-4R]|uniref:hypothetical protein n=1 Tax=Paenibacillus sp. KN14-4R TaxID=3445773 RepID=UPI003FA06AAA